MYLYLRCTIATFSCLFTRMQLILMNAGLTIGPETSRFHSCRIRNMNCECIQRRSWGHTLCFQCNSTEKKTQRRGWPTMFLISARIISFPVIKKLHNVAWFTRYVFSTKLFECLLPVQHYCYTNLHFSSIYFFKISHKLILLHRINHLMVDCIIFCLLLSSLRKKQHLFSVNTWNVDILKLSTAFDNLSTPQR